MIKLTPETLELASSKSYASGYGRRFKLFGVETILRKRGKGEFLVWTTRDNYSSKYKDVLITVHGKLTYNSLKNELERMLNYQPSHLRYSIIKELLK